MVGLGPPLSRVGTLAPATAIAISETELRGVAERRQSLSSPQGGAEVQTPKRKAGASADRDHRISAIGTPRA